MRRRSRNAAIGLIVALGLVWPGSAQDDVEVRICAAEADWINCADGVRSIGPRATAMLHLRSHVSQGRCIPARVVLTASYTDPSGDVLCVGTMDGIAQATGNVQDFTIEVSPRTLGTFARWRNRPGQAAEPPYEPLMCASPDGRRDLLDTHLASAVGLELVATVLPSDGGLAVAGCRIVLPR